MKIILATLGLGALVLGAGCASPDRPRTDAEIGEASRPTTNVYIGTREFDEATDREIGSEDFSNFATLSDYDFVLTPQERMILRARARDARDDPDDYLDYLTEEEKANLRQRAERLD